MATKMKSLPHKLGLAAKKLKPTVKKPLLRRKSDLIFVKTGKTELLSSPFKNKKLEFPRLLLRRKMDLERIHGLTDAELIVVVHTQNREAYYELFARYQKKLFAYILHLVGNKDETEDILQNVFSKTFKNIEHFDTSRKFSSWIYRIAHNEAVNFLKRRSKRYTISWDDVSTSKDKLDIASNEELPEDIWAHKEIKEEIDHALLILPQKYQQVLKLRYFKDYSYEAIAKVLGKPVNTVGTLINRAKKKLLEVVKAGEYHK